MNFANGAETTLTAAITNASATMNVADASRFPAPPFHVAVDQELMTVTAVAATTFTITRGIEGTTPAAHAIGAVVANTVTAGDYAGFGSGGGGGDMLAMLVNSPNSIVNADATLVAAKLNVVTATTGNHVVSMPAPVAKIVIGILISPSSTKLVTVAPNAAETINFRDNTSRIMWAGEFALFYCDGLSWFILPGGSRPMDVRLELTTDYATIFANTWTGIPVPTFDFGTTLLFDGTNNRVVAQRAGRMTINTAAYVKRLTGTITFAYIGAGLNGSPLTWYQQSAAIGDTGAGSFGAEVDVVSGDYLQPFVYTDGTTSKILGAGGSFISAVEKPPW